MPLTDKGLRSLRAEAKDQFVSDGEGLYVRVRASGTKTFVFRSQAGGSSRWVSIGTYPEMSLAEARREATLLRGRALATPMTFAEAWERYERHILRTLRRPENYQFLAGTYLLPQLGKKTLHTITRADVSKVLQGVVDRGAITAAKRALSVARLLFGFAEAHGWLDENVLEKFGAGALGAPYRSRTRHLSPTEIHDLVACLRRAPQLPHQRKLAYGLLLLTGQRRSEVLGMQAAEIRGAWWIIPAARTKSLREQHVYLNVQARVLWQDAVRRYGETPFRGIRGEIFSDGFRKLVLRNALAHCTVHDLRRTMATRLADEGVAPHVIEKMLNHQMTGVMAVYNRAKYLPEQRAAWRLWGALVNQWRKNRPPVSSQRAEPSLGEGRRER